MNLPELGVGLNWFLGLEPVLRANEELVDVLEVEPQALWRRDRNADGLVLDWASLEGLRRQRVPKLIHSVALPVGGSLAPSAEEMAQLSSVTRDLDAPWVS